MGLPHGARRGGRCESVGGAEERGVLRPINSVAVSVPVSPDPQRYELVRLDDGFDCYAIFDRDARAYIQWSRDRSGAIAALRFIQRFVVEKSVGERSELVVKTEWESPTVWNRSASAGA